MLAGSGIPKLRIGCISSQNWKMCLVYHNSLLERLGKIDILVTKGTDDFLVAATKYRIESFMKELKNAFEVAKVTIGN